MGRRNDRMPVTSPYPLLKLAADGQLVAWTGTRWVRYRGRGQRR